ncbi:MAG: helix-turn-helix domain-containing protein [Oscillospiraceae bacterium]|nr:helix-turn-helix domain-containing protein [Oscillospiraceae bacterium]
MRIIKCDRCGAELPPEHYENTGHVSLIWRSIYNYEAVSANPYEFWDLCEECMADINECIRMKKARPGAEEIPEKFDEVLKSVDAGKKKKKAGPHKWDKGKAQALRDAGWKIKDIAAELGVHESTVRAHTIAPEPKKVYENEWAQHEPDLAVATRSMMGEKHLEEEEE